MWEYNYTTELYHHGVQGQKWGVRRYQNPDGTLTAAGQKRQARYEKKATNKYKRAGYELGRGEFNKNKADEISNFYKKRAVDFDKKADALKDNNNHIRSNLYRHEANESRKKSRYQSEDYYEAAEIYVYSGNRKLANANKFATKKNVSLGEKKVNEILNDGRVKGYKVEKDAYELEQLIADAKYEEYYKRR